MTSSGLYFNCLAVFNQLVLIKGRSLDDQGSYHYYISARGSLCSRVFRNRLFDLEVKVGPGNLAGSFILGFG